MQWHGRKPSPSIAAIHADWSYVCPAQIADRAYATCAGTLPDHVQPQGVPPIPEGAVSGHAAYVLLRRLVLCGGRHFHALPHAGTSHHHLDRSLPSHHQQMGCPWPDHLCCCHPSPAVLCAHTQVSFVRKCIAASNCKDFSSAGYPLSDKPVDNGQQLSPWLIDGGGVPVLMMTGQLC